MGGQNILRKQLSSLGFDWQNGGMEGPVEKHLLQEVGV